ncbi:MAG: matrixin family metalloprotease [Dehalococcoidia bacterium]
MKRFRWLSVAILFIIVSSLLPLAFTSAAQADSGKINLKDLTNGADSVLVGTVTDRNSYWNDAHTQIYTSVAFSVEDRIKGEAGPDKVTITVPGGEVEGIGEFVSEMPSFDQGEKAVVFLKKLNNAQPSKAMSLPDKFPAQQFEVYQGFRGKFPIKGDKANNLPVAEFKGRINSVLKGQALPATELDISPSVVTMPYLYAGYSWPSNKIPVGYRINENTSDSTGEGAAVQNAASTWSTAGANFSFSYAGTTTATAYGYDGVNEIMWVNTLDTGILAVTHIWYSGSTLLENDVEFNDYYNWSTLPTCPGGYYDVQSVGLHEFGHWLCLDDLYYGPADAAKVMYGYSGSGTTKRALTADDIAGIQSIYGTSSSSDPQQLIGVASGTTSTGGSGGGVSGTVILQRFLATSTGSIAEFRVKVSASGNVKVAIYDDSSGQPNSRLAAVDSSTPVTTVGWNTIPITPSIAVTSGTYYWLALVSDSANIYYHSNDPSATVRWKPSTYASWTWPSSAGVGWNIQTGYTYFVAGRSAITPPTSPTITNSIGATNITSTSARLNGEVTSTGNENPAVTVYYGTTDGGTTTGSWANHVDLGTKALGTFYTDVSNLIPNAPYFYRCYASNSAGPAWAGTSAQFTTPVQTQILIGVATDTASTGGNGGGASGTVILQRFLAASTGSITEFRVKVSAGGNVKVAIYDDNSGQPNSRLAVVDSTPVTTGWNTIPITSTPVTSGTYYWLAVVSDSANIYYHSNDPSATVRWQPSTYASWTWPGSAGSGWNTQTGYTYFIAGWGTTTPHTPPNPPDPISPGAAIILKWGAPNGATKYQLQVGTSSSFTTTVFDADVGNNTSQEVTGLSFGTIYYWRARAGNIGGWSNWSTTISFTVNQVP